MSAANPGFTSLSVLVPTYARAALLPRVVAAWAALAPSLAAELDYQLVVVDDGSPDGTAEVLSELAGRYGDLITVVRQANGGRAAARNAAIAAARGDLLLFSDDDMVPLSPDLLTRHLEAQAERPGAWVSHLQVPDECAVTPFQAYWRRRLHGGTDALENGAELGFGGFWFASLSLPRELLGLERFNESFRGYGWEEHEMGYRLYLAGVRARFLRGAYLAHHDPVTLEGTLRKYEAMGRAAWTFSRLHRGARVGLWTGTHPVSRALRRLTGVERRAQALLARGEGAFTDAQYRLLREGAYGRGLRLGRGNVGEATNGGAGGAENAQGGVTDA